MATWAMGAKSKTLDVGGSGEKEEGPGGTSPSSSATWAC